MEDCFSLPEIDYIKIKPISEAWISDKRIDFANPEISQNILMTIGEAIQRHLVISYRDPIIIYYPTAEGNIPLTFVVKELRYKGNVIPAGLSTSANEREIPIIILPW
jgi:hypothetical protein